MWEGQDTAAAACDWGDCPDPTYPTLAPAGPSHLFDGELFLGATLDTEADGQPIALD